MKKYNQPRPPRTSISATRERLAFTLVLLFAIVSLAVVFVPGASAAQQSIPFVAGMLMVVVGYYFKRHKCG